MDDPKLTKSETAGRATRILVVDDSQDTARMMRVLLKGHGYEVKIAFSGREAIEVADGFRPDVVLLDLTLPDMSGAEVAEVLRGAPMFERTAIVAISGYGIEHVPAHFDGHFVKPVDHDALIAHLSRLTVGAGVTVREGACLPPTSLKL